MAQRGSVNISLSHFIKAETLSAGVHNQAQIPSPSNIYEEYVRGPQAARPFPPLANLLPSFPLYITPMCCGCENIIHYFAPKNEQDDSCKSTLVIKKGTNDPLSWEGGSGQMKILCHIYPH